MTEKDENSTRLDGQLLYSERFDDFYSTRSEPDQEKRFVFCEGNKLHERFAKAGHFIIAELGFGAGLGFLSTAELWQQTAPPGAHLHFFSIEKYPLDRTTLQTALQPFSQWESLSHTLLRQWPVPVPGFHQIAFPESRITLTLVFADVLDALRQMEASVDAWFLDGFSPAKNPEMWRPAVLKEIARLSYQQTTFATYTAAGQVRRDLTAAGFIVTKGPGFGQKRERLLGHFRNRRTAAFSRIQKHLRPTNRSPETRSVTIIGAGLAGCACANRLAARGYRVTLLEAGSTVAAGTSKNPAAIMQPFLSLDDNTASHFSRQGYCHTLQKAQQLALQGISSGFHGGGLFSLPKSKDDALRKKRIAENLRFPESWMEMKPAEHIPGLPADIHGKGIFYPATGWFDLERFCRALVDEYPQKITIMTGQRVEALDYRSDHWRLQTKNHHYSSQCVVIANGHAVAEFRQTRHLPILANSGQITFAACSHPPPLAISHSGYIVPIDDDTLCFGSTYTINSLETSATTENDARNLASVQALSPRLHQQIDDKTLRGWAGIRATTADHLPLVGEIPNPAAFRDIHGPWLLGKKAGNSPDSPFHPGLYCCTGLGSRAMTSGILSGELIASLINAEPLPVERAVYEAIHPARFLSRELKASAG